MVTRAVLAGARPIAAIEATLPVRPVGDVRQEDFTRLNQLEIGKFLRADVLSKLAPETFLVRIEGAEARVNLPAGTQVGDKIPLTFIGAQPRPTFLLGQPAGDDTSTVSTAGRLLNQVLELAQRDGASVTVQGRTPLLPAAPAAPRLAAPQIATVLRDAVGVSGVFYESHLQQWTEGARSLTALLREPQAQGAHALGAVNTVYPAMARLISQLGDSGKSMEQVLQNPQFRASTPALMRELTTAYPVLNRLLVQAGAAPLPGAIAASLPGTLVPSPAGALLPSLPGALPPTLQDSLLQSALTDAGIQPHAAAAAATAAQGAAAPNPALLVQSTTLPALPPAAQKAVEMAQSHPLLTQLIGLFGQPANAEIPLPALLQKPEFAAIIRQAAAEVAQPAPELARLLREAPPSAQQAAAASTQPMAAQAAGDIPLDAVIKADTALSAALTLPASVTPETAQIVNQQLHALEQRHLHWVGELWPGQTLEWEIQEEERPPKSARELPETWTSTVHFELPLLGRVSAHVRLAGDRVALQLQVARPSSVERLRAHGGELSASMEAAGLPLDLFTVKQDG